MRDLHADLRITCLLVLVGLAGSGCAVPSLKPAAIGRTVDGYAITRRSGDQFTFVAGTSSLTLCDSVKAIWERNDGISYGDCRAVTFDMAGLPANVYVAIGSNPDYPQLNLYTFVGGPTQGDCDLVRTAMSQRNYKVANQYGWTEVPCRPAVLTVR
jgi:hypothetical protein